MTSIKPSYRNWRRVLADTYGIFEKMRRSRTSSDICACLLSYGASFGATNILAGVVPSQYLPRREQISHVMLHAWPEEWADRYFDNGYLYCDPTIELVRRFSRPFRWSDVGDQYEVAPFGRRIMEEATEFGLNEGLTIAFSTIEQRPVGFSMAGKKLDPDPCEQLALVLVGAYAFGCASILAMSQDECKRVHLSPRQRDVLHWASEGLTINDIAERLNISTNTADTHLRAARERLGVSSTIHAVAEAFRLGLIS